jgi:hypothetical protein
MMSTDDDMIVNAMASEESSLERKAELCSNWWPDPRLSHAENVPGMPHTLCRVCANWLPDIEDIGVAQKKSGCGNDWSKERNLKKPQ